MGASDFSNIGVGKEMGQVYDELRREAQYEYGHRYDSGTIGSTGGFRKVDLPKGLTAAEFRDACMSIFHPQFRACDDWECHDRNCMKGLEQYTSRKAEHVKFRQTPWGAAQTKIYKKVMKDPALLRLVLSLADQLTDKGSCVGVEVTGAAAKAHIDQWLRYRGTTWVNGKQVAKPRPRGLKVFYFFGLAPS